ncbi:MAG TPA: tetratricopeptide repeat protein [Terriglobia bacterium]|nr:tetratricopeptide repeat protein [Terriglobia bacterium]
MANLKRLLTNRIVLSLFLILALASVFEFYLHPLGGPFYKSGLDAFRLGNYPLSIKMLREAKKYEPNDPDVLSLLGWNLLKTGNPAGAEKQFMAAQRLKPHDMELQLGLAYAEMNLGRTTRAERALDELRKERPGWIEILIAQGFLFLHEGLPALAGVEFRQALSRSPNNPVVLKNLQQLSAQNHSVQPLSPPSGLGNLIPTQGAAAPPPVIPSPITARNSLSLAQERESRDQFPEAIARYGAYLKSHPGSVRALYALGALLLRTDQPQEAVPVFRRILFIDSKNFGGILGLAECLAETGQYREALFRYQQALRASPGNYEAEQGMANALIWTGLYFNAKPFFEALAAENPQDPVNQHALQTIASAEEEMRLASLRPATGSPPAVFVRFDQAYLAHYPKDHAALADLAANQTKLKDFAGAISTYRRIVSLYPYDQDSEFLLANDFAWTKHYAEAIQIYLELLKKSPRDPALLRSLAQTDLWANRLPESLQLDQQLLKQQPDDAELMTRIAGLEMRLKQYPEARQSYATLAALRLGNRNAELGLAALDEKRSDWKGARREYQKVLARHPHDPAALYGDARLAYYQEDFEKALGETERLIHEEPKNTDALLLASRLESALGKRRQAKALVARASQLAPGNSEVGEMQQKLSQEAAVTIHTSSTYAREVGPLTDYFSPQGVLIFRIPNEDLNTYSNAVTVGFPLFPRSQSSISFASMPSNSPRGGMQGAVAPSEFQYRQSTDVASFLTLRGGIGFERLGPGQSATLPGQNPALPERYLSIPVTEITPVGYGGFTIRPTRQLSLDFDISRDGVATTPLSVRFGVIQVRKLAGLRYKLDRRDQVYITYYHDTFNSSLFDALSQFNGGTTTLSANGIDKATGGTLDYDRSLIQSKAFSLDMGYSGLAFGYTGPNRGVYMGFFNPAFYQRHFATAGGKGHIWGPLSYSFDAGYGLQQLGHQQPFIAAYQVNPNLNILVNPRLSVTLGYVHYNFGQSLGQLSGNAVQISTDSKFW